MNTNTLNTLLQDKVQTNLGVTASFFDYDAKQEYPAPNNKRLVTCLYRSKGGKEAARPNQAMFIPDWITPEVVTNNIDRLSEYVVSYLQDQEQELVRGKHKDMSTMLGSSVFTLDTLLDYLDNKGAGARLTGDSIKAWYSASGLQDALMQLYQEKTGSGDKAAALVDFIEKKLVSLASPKTSWTEVEAEKILPLLDSIDEQGGVKGKLIARIAAMDNNADEDLLNAL